MYSTSFIAGTQMAAQFGLEFYDDLNERQVGAPVESIVCVLTDRFPNRIPRDEVSALFQSIKRAGELPLSIEKSSVIYLSILPSSGNRTKVADRPNGVLSKRRGNFWRS